MKAEELINRVSRRYDCLLLALHKPEIVTKKNAQYAVEIARQEERENAVKQLNVVLTAIIARNDSKINFGDIIDQFTELINQ